MSISFIIIYQRLALDLFAPHHFEYNLKKRILTPL